jgi:hypothetical protein
LATRPDEQAMRGPDGQRMITVSTDKAERFPEHGQRWGDLFLDAFGQLWEWRPGYLGVDRWWSIPKPAHD